MLTILQFLDHDTNKCLVLKEKKKSYIKSDLNINNKYKLFSWWSTVSAAYKTHLDKNYVDILTVSSVTAEIIEADFCFKLSPLGLENFWWDLDK